MITGCATSYTKEGFFNEGFSETRLDEDVFRVTFKGNEMTDKDRVEDFALLRSAELTLTNGFRFFVIAEDISREKVSVHHTPAQAQTQSTISHTPHGVITREARIVTPAQSQIYTKHHESKLIYCYKERPSEGFVYDAKFVANSIRQKYDIKETA